MTPGADACCLCSQIRGDETNDLIARLLPGEPYVRRVLLETASFAVLPSLGPLVAGHVLLCPKAHIRSFAQLPVDTYAEYAQVKARLRHFLAAAFHAGVQLFEHGASSAGKRRVCTVDHAHMHFVPLPPSLGPVDLGGEEWAWCDGSPQSLAGLSAGSEYIFYEAADGVSRLLVAREREVESQYMRKVLATSLGKGGAWNWREAPDARAADQTWRRWSEAAAAAVASGV
jgi:diadenosine tetraphosphate (Ap4A) HIT family hydrolase